MPLAAGFDTPTANEPVTFIPATDQRMRPHRTLSVQITQASSLDYDHARRSFWALLGDLAADVLLDRVDGPWGSADDDKQGILAP